MVNAITHPLSFIRSLLVVLAVIMLAVPSAFAVTPEKKFAGKIIVSEKNFPSRFDTDAAMIKHMKKANTHELFAKGEGDWEFEYMAFLKKPVGTLQASITFYDISVPGTETLIDSFTFYPDNAKHKILNGHQRLSKSKFQKDRKYMMVFARGYGQPALSKTILVLRR